MKYDDKRIILSVHNRKHSSFIPQFNISEIIIHDIKTIHFEIRNTYAMPNQILPICLIVEDNNGNTIEVDTKPITKKVFWKMAELCKNKGIDSSAIERVLQQKT